MRVVAKDAGTVKMSGRPSEGQKGFMRQNGLDWEPQGAYLTHEDVKELFQIDLPLERAFEILRSQGIQHITISDITTEIVQRHHSEHMSNGYWRDVAYVHDEQPSGWKSVTLEGRQ